MQEEYYTLKGYQTTEGAELTTAMEDYLEMVCRLSREQVTVRGKELAGKLHVKPSSASKMICHLKETGYIKAEKYGAIFLTEKGYREGTYLLYRHEILHRFLCALNHSENELEQVEKIEHFFNRKTIYNLEKLTESMKNACCN